MRLAKRYAKRAADGGMIFDPDYLKSSPEKSAKQRVMEGHQEFEQGYGPAGSMPWEAPRWRKGINSRGQEVNIIKAAAGGRAPSLDDIIERIRGKHATD